MKEKCVLMVDDDHIILSLAKIFFESHGLEVDCAENGEEALHKIQERPFFMMITDFNMPGIDGLELAAKVRGIAPLMPIFMASGNASPEIRRLAEEIGIAKVFAKPLCFETILMAMG